MLFWTDVGEIPHPIEVLEINKDLDVTDFRSISLVDIAWQKFNQDISHNHPLV